MTCTFPRSNNCPASLSFEILNSPLFQINEGDNEVKCQDSDVSSLDKDSRRCSLSVDVLNSPDCEDGPKQGSKEEAIFRSVSTSELPVANTAVQQVSVRPAYSLC